MGGGLFAYKKRFMMIKKHTSFTNERTATKLQRNKNSVKK